MSAPTRPQALVTGASRGVGAAVAAALSATHDVLLGGRDVAALKEAAARLPGSRPWPVELTDPDALTSATSSIDRLAVLVHCAGTVELVRSPRRRPRCGGITWRSTWSPWPS